MATLICGAGSYTLIGSRSVTDWQLGVTAGSYAVTGTDATTIHGFLVVAAGGAYTLTGGPVLVMRITAEPAGYLITGFDATLTLAAKRTAADSGSYTLTGVSAILELSNFYNLASYSISGTAADLLRSGTPGVLAAAVGSYAITGGSTALESVLVMDAGDYNITGTDVCLPACPAIA
jgi:hypothetical protein